MIIDKDSILVSRILNIKLLITRSYRYLSHIISIEMDYFRI